MHFLIKLIDLVFLMRPILFIPVWGFALLGYFSFSSQETVSNSIFLFPADFGNSFFMLAIFSLSVGAVNILNQVIDYEVDAQNEGFPLLVKSNITKKEAIIFSIIISLISILIPLFMKSYLVAMGSVGAILIGVVYCVKPFYFTGRPFLDFISNAIGFGVIAFGVGWVLAGGGLDGFLKSSFAYFLLMSAGSISSTLPDIKGDRLEGKITTAVFLSRTYAHILATVFIVSTLLYSYIINDKIALLSAVISLPIYLVYLFIKKEPVMEATYKIGGGLLMLIIALVYPYFILPAIAILLLTIIYFRLRFGISYPSLIPVSES